MSRSARLLSLSFLLSAAGLASAGSLAPPGPPGPTFKTLGEIEPRSVLQADPGVVAPLVIDEPGSYYLTGNVTAIPDNPAITISASNVTLDLNGFTVSGNMEVADGHGIHVIGSHVTIRNGTVRNADGDGIFCNSGPLTLLEVNAVHNAGSGATCVELRVVGGNFSNNGVNGVGGLRALIEGVRANDNGNAGIAVGTGSAISRSMANSNGFVGLNCAQGASLVTQTVARSNVGGNRLGCVVFDSEIP
jgi:hypothetical protein